MASLNSNQPEVDAALASIVEDWDFTSVGQDQSLGRDLATGQAEQMYDRGAAGVDPDHVDWLANEDRYRRYKKKHYGVVQPNIRTGQMLSRESLRGETTISADLVEMKYGTATPPTKTAVQGELTDADKSITDIEKAFFCSPTRPFYAINADDAEKARETSQESLDKFAEETW